MESMPILEFAQHNQEPEWLQVKRQVVSQMLTSFPIDNDQIQYQFKPPKLLAQPVNPQNLANEDLKQRGGIIMDLFAAANRYPNFIQENLMEKAIEWRKNALNARHLSYLQSGGFVYIPPNTIIDDPIDLSSLINHEQQEKHLLIILGAGSKAIFSFVDRNVNIENDCLMVELLLGDHATVQYFDEVQSNASHHHRILNSYLAQNAQLATNVGIFNRGDLRYESNLNLDGQGSIGKINIVSYADHNQHQAIYTSTAGEGLDTHGEIHEYGFINDSAIVEHESTGEIHATSFNSYFHQLSHLFEINNLSKGILQPRLNVDTDKSKCKQLNKVIRIDQNQFSNYLGTVDQELSSLLSDDELRWFQSHVLNQIDVKR